MSDKINDGGPAFIVCRKCDATFTPAAWQLAKHDYECSACKRLRQNTANRTNPNFAAKQRARNRLPHVKAYLSAYRVKRMAEDPSFRVIRAARRKVATELEAGRMTRGLCEVCGAIKTEAHHEDYAKPLDVRWLCRSHHAIADAMLAARNGGAA